MFPYRLPDPARRFAEEATNSLTRSLSKTELNRQETMFNFAMEESLFLLDLHALQDVSNANLTPQGLVLKLTGVTNRTSPLL